MPCDRMTRTSRARFLAVAALAASLLASTPASAGDEVDYSAPYLVVENGELVTRYPDKQHENAGAGGETDAAGEVAGESAEGGRAEWVLAAALVAVIIGLLLLLRRVRRRSPGRVSGGA